MPSIDMLKALLEVDEDGDQIAALISELLIDEQKRDLLLVKLNEAKKETLILRQDVRLQTHLTTKTAYSWPGTL